MARKASPFPPKTDFFTKTGAGLIVDHIKAYWTTRGFPGIVATRYQIPGFDLYGVRTNLVGGLPPRRRR